MLNVRKRRWNIWLFGQIIEITLISPFTLILPMTCCLKKSLSLEIRPKVVKKSRNFESTHTSGNNQDPESEQPPRLQAKFPISDEYYEMLPCCNYPCHDLPCLFFHVFFLVAGLKTSCIWVPVRALSNHDFYMVTDDIVAFYANRKSVLSFRIVCCKW